MGLFSRFSKVQPPKEDEAVVKAKSFLTRQLIKLDKISDESRLLDAYVQEILKGFSEDPPNLLILTQNKGKILNLVHDLHKKSLVIGKHLQELNESLNSLTHQPGGDFVEAADLVPTRHVDKIRRVLSGVVGKQDLKTKDMIKNRLLKYELVHGVYTHLNDYHSACKAAQRASYEVGEWLKKIEVEEHNLNYQLNELNEAKDFFENFLASPLLDAGTQAKASSVSKQDFHDLKAESLKLIGAANKLTASADQSKDGLRAVLRSSAYADFREATRIKNVALGNLLEALSQHIRDDRADPHVKILDQCIEQTEKVFEEYNNYQMQSSPNTAWSEFDNLGDLLASEMRDLHYWLSLQNLKTAHSPVEIVKRMMINSKKIGQELLSGRQKRSSFPSNGANVAIKALQSELETLKQIRHEITLLKTAA